MITEYERDLIKTIKDREAEIVAIEYASRRMFGDPGLYILDLIKADLIDESVKAAEELIRVRKDRVR